MGSFKKPSDLDRFALQRMTELQTWMEKLSTAHDAQQHQQQQQQQQQQPQHQEQQEEKQQHLHKQNESITWILKDAVANRGNGLLVLYSIENVTQVRILPRSGFGRSGGGVGVVVAVNSACAASECLRVLRVRGCVRACVRACMRCQQ
jgi:hypothetical protein